MASDATPCLAGSCGTQQEGRRDDDNLGQNLTYIHQGGFSLEGNLFAGTKLQGNVCNIFIHTYCKT